MSSSQQKWGRIPRPTMHCGSVSTSFCPVAASPSMRKARCSNQNKSVSRVVSSQNKKKENLTHEMDYPGACQGRPCGLPLADYQVYRQGRRVSLCADRPGDGGGRARRGHTLRRERGGTGPSRQRVLL